MEFIQRFPRHFTPQLGRILWGVYPIVKSHPQRYPQPFFFLQSEGFPSAVWVSGGAVACFFLNDKLPPAGAAGASSPSWTLPHEQ
jgi:hypothetical protein